MKTLLFLRHGKSDWDAQYSHDHERPLAKRGWKAADAMGRLLADSGQIPDSIISSSAVRARRTQERARTAGAWPSTVRVTDTLYGASSYTILHEIRAEPNTTQSLMLVGHEPTWSQTVEAFMGGGEVRFPTAAVARIDLFIDRWADADFGQGQLIYLLPPRLFS